MATGWSRRPRGASEAACCGRLRAYSRTRLIYVSVDDLRASLEKAEELGGKKVVEPMPIPAVGTFAMFQDPDGVVIGLFEEKMPRAQP